jgi:hypothetical protein
MAGQLRQWDIGSIIRVKVIENGAVFNASGATDYTLKLKRPSGYVLEVPAKFETNGADGVFTYETVEGDLSETGPWSGQVFMKFETGSWHTDLFNFTVGENLSQPAPPVVVPLVVLA